MERELKVLMGRAGVDLNTVHFVRRFYERQAEDLWNFSSPESCQHMLDSLVTMKDGHTLGVSGQDLFDALPAYDAEIEAANTAEQDSNVRKAAIFEVKEYAIGLIADRVPAVNSQIMLDFLAELWPMLDKSQAGADMVAVGKIASNMRTRVRQIKNGTIEQVEAYDPVTDPDWT